jgi:hypothetical protein
MAAMAPMAVTQIGIIVIIGLAPVALAATVAAVPEPASAHAAVRAAMAVPELPV